jgi:hypothetical protein
MQRGPERDAEQQGEAELVVELHGPDDISRAGRGRCLPCGIY